MRRNSTELMPAWDGVSPGGGWAVVQPGAVVAEGVYGGYVYPREVGEPLGQTQKMVDGVMLADARVSGDTSWDVASLTKVVAGTAMAMLLWQDRRLPLMQPVVEVVPEFGDNGDTRRQAVTLEMLLRHISGLPDHVRLWEGEDNPQIAACRVPLRAGRRPGEVTEYSDVGFIVLGLALERLAGEPIDRYVQRRVWEPLGMADTTYCPAAEWKRRCAPTNGGTDFRGRIIQGEVHDENAAAMGGVSAHAGVFSTVRDVTRFAQCMLRGGEGVFERETVDYFTQRRGERALGWDLVNQPGSSTGRYFSERSFGHLGYTGTSLWIDPEDSVAVVLLNNRVWPDSRNDRIKQFRPKFHDWARTIAADVLKSET